MSATTTLARARSSALPLILTLSVGIVAMVGLFWPECQAAVKVWMESTAYGHCFLVVPIALYLLWDRRDNLRGLVPKPTLELAVLALPLPFIWLAAERLGIMEGRQLIVIAMLQVFFLTVFGWRMYRSLSGPLLYLFFLVPFGMFLTSSLQAFTAKFIDVGLAVLGIPHFITDMTIEISAGTFYVAEACAGLRFLIASIAFGVFFSLLNYNSAGRRFGFIVASTIVPIIANGFRALGIVVLGNILGSAQAAAADHIVYGWFFFSFVTLMLVLAGLPFRQQPLPPPPRDDTGTRNATRGASLPVFARTALPLVVLAAIGPAAAMALDRSTTGARLANDMTLLAPPGCQIEPLTRSAPDHLATTMTCGERVWRINVQGVPGRSTGAALSEARRSLVGPIEAEEIVAGPLHDTEGWQRTVSNEPGVVVATAGWIDGELAPGGLRQRLIQARDSVLGTKFDGVAMGVSWRPAHSLSDNEIDAALAELVRFIKDQPGLTAMVAKASARAE